MHKVIGTLYTQQSLIKICIEAEKESMTMGCCFWRKLTFLPLGKWDTSRICSARVASTRFRIESFRPNTAQQYWLRNLLDEIERRIGKHGTQWELGIMIFLIPAARCSLHVATRTSRKRR